MSTVFASAHRPDDGSAATVGGARRRQGRRRPRLRFSYPRLDPAAPPGRQPEPPATFSQAELASAVEAARRDARAEAEAELACAPRAARD